MRSRDISAELKAGRWQAAIGAIVSILLCQILCKMQSTCQEDSTTAFLGCQAIQ
jgi:hypothetical protein